MNIPCQWRCYHPGQNIAASNVVILPGKLDGGIEWFGGPEPDIRLTLCGPCTEQFIANNGERVIVEAIKHNPPEAPLTGGRIETL